MAIAFSDVRFRGNSGHWFEVPECLLLMLWTAPAPRHRSAIDWLRQNQSDSQGGKTRQQRRRLKFEEIGEDRRGNADKVDPGVGKPAWSAHHLIGTRSALSIMAS